MKERKKESSKQRDVNVYWKSLLATYAFATNQMTAKRHVQLAERGGRRGEGRAGEGGGGAKQANCYGHVSGQQQRK